MKALFLSIVTISLSVTVLFAQNKNRKSFNDRWKFKLDSINRYRYSNDADDALWRELNLPHDWSIEGSFDKNNPAGVGGGALPGGIGWYRKTFTIPVTQKNQQVLIDFDGVYRNSEVFINGHSLGIRPNGYISFQYDLTPYLKYGSEKNIIAVKVDNSKQPNSRWYSGSGIYRNVWLTVVNKIHVAQWGVTVTTPVITKEKASIQLNYTLANSSGSPVWLKLNHTLYDASNKQVAQIEKTGRIRIPDPSAGGKTSFDISNPELWSLDRPHLYRLVTKVIVDNNVVDTYETSFGIRSFSFDAEKGFFLNGKSVKILGVCNHHDLGALGAAINTRALERQLELLKKMGCNGIRTSHNPPAPELLELADKMGFIVMDEAFDMWAKSKSPFDYHLDWSEWHKKDLEDFVKRDRNHPSVFIWSIGNEILEQWGDEKKNDTSGRAIARELVAIVKSLDTTRPITTGNNEIQKWNQIIQSNAFELIGYNYGHKKWGSFLKDWPGKKLIVTESTSALETRGYYDNVPFDTLRRWPVRWDIPFQRDNGEQTVSAYDHVSTPWGSTHEESVRELKKWDHVSGMYIWTGFDYLGEPTPYSWPARSSYFGIIDLAGFPKDVYYLYQSEFTDKPVLHLFPHWNWNAGDTVDVVSYYNNADEVELFLNGKSLGKRSKSLDTFHVKWRVPFVAGKFKAVSYKKGKQVLVREVQTAGEAYKLVLKADRKKIKADNRDLSFITIEIVDKNGVLVPKANHLIRFSLSGNGTIAAVDSGSPVSMESFKSDQHTALNGKALCIVQAGNKKGTITVKATAEGLQSSSITINAE